MSQRLRQSGTGSRGVQGLGQPGRCADEGLQQRGPQAKAGAGSSRHRDQDRVPASIAQSTLSELEPEENTYADRQSPSLENRVTGSARGRHGRPQVPPVLGSSPRPTGTRVPSRTAHVRLWQPRGRCGLGARGWGSQGHTCRSSLLEAAQNLLTQEVNQPSHNLGAEKERRPHVETEKRSTLDPRFQNHRVCKPLGAEGSGAVGRLVTGQWAPLCGMRVCTTESPLESSRCEGHTSCDLAPRPGSPFTFRAGKHQGRPRPPYRQARKGFQALLKGPGLGRMQAGVTSYLGSSTQPH